ncbi:MAG TPA: Gfo/Idh/MocA family oxidoreductase [Bryobacteraceae bacterium]|nr:Gfo/Idh/MocA family oxidoreductase [Bryobacteraceae bacterium]
MSVNRRSFLLATPLTARAATWQDTPKVPTAVIGVGGRGSYLLSGVLQQNNTKVVMLCDIKPDRLDKAATAAAKDNPKTTSDWRQVLANKDVEAVYIATPPYLHAEMATAAIQAGKHVYCEKPIGLKPAEIKRLLAAAKSSKKVFVAGQQLRSMTQLQEAVGKIHDGIIGDIVMVKAQRHATADLPHDGSSGDWFFDVAKGGGYLVEQSVHNLDLCNWVLNGHPTKACGFGAINFYKNQPAGRTIFDCGSIVYNYPNNVQMSFTQNVFHPRSMPAGNQFIHVFGTKGAVDLMGAATMYPIDGGAPVVLAEKRRENQFAHIEMFYAAITEGKPAPINATVGATAALTAILGHEAMAKQAIVNWSDFGIDL